LACALYGFGVTYDINGRPAELFAKTARGLARAYDVDIPSHLIKAGLMLALGGRIDFGNQLWHRAVTSGLPNLNHAFGLGPFAGRLRNRGQVLDIGPDGTPLPRN